MTVTIRSDDKSIDWCATGTDRIIQNVRNILRTRKYEVPFMRDLGISADIIDNSFLTLKNDVIEDVKKVIAKYEDRATVVDVSLASSDENGDCVIEVILEV